jgi:uncharacterized integral membrane protein
MAEDVGAAKQSSRQWKDYLTARNIIAAVIGIAALLFIFQNTKTGHFHFLWFDISAPTWFWLLGLFAAGFGTGLLFARLRAKRATDQTKARRPSRPRRTPQPADSTPQGTGS